MSDITDADREAVSRLIEVIRDAKAEGVDIEDCHEIWRSAFAAHRIAAARAERERIASLVGAMMRAEAHAYAGQDGGWALDEMAYVIEALITTNSEAKG